MDFSDYGVVILDTKSRKKGESGSFEMRTFIKFSKSLWPKAQHDANAQRGGRKIADTFKAFFTVGGPKALAPPLEATDRVGEAIAWDMYSGDVGLKCGSLLNWPNCEHEAPQGQSTLDRFLTDAPPDFITLSIPSEKELLDSQIVIVLLKFDHKKRKEEAEYFSPEFSYVQFDARRNKYFAPEKLQITREKQEWLSARAKDIVVFTTSMSESIALPLIRLKYLFSHYESPKIQVLCADFTWLKKCESISLCPDGHFAVTKQTPGTDNICDNNDERMLTASFEDICRHEEPMSQNQVSNEDMPMDIDEMYEPHFEAVMDSDVDLVSTSDQAAGHPSLQAFCRTFTRKQDKQQITLERILKAEERLQEGVCSLDTRMKQVQNEMIVQEELRKAALKYSTLQLERKFGLDADHELEKKLEQLKSIGIEFTEKQKSWLLNLPWLQLVLDTSDLTNSFLRCKLCSREAKLRDDALWFRHYSTVTPCPDEKCVNLMGAGSVLCIKRVSNYYRGWGAGIVRAVGRHPNSKEHEDGLKSYHMALGAQEQQNQDLAVKATVTATVGAYTIAKQGLPLTSQFPLMMFALRAGAVVGSAHYEATTAKRMIKTFAVHIEYELFSYVIANDLPFSILMDGSSSSRGTKWMAYMIRTIITDVLLSHLNELDSWVTSPGLRISPHEHAMKRLIAITTDGAATMTGCDEGVFGRLQRHIQSKSSSPVRTELLLSVCAAHQLNIAMKNANHIAYKLARALIMEMHTIFGTSQSSSARRHYKDIARLMSFPNLQMGQFFAIRWSDSFSKGLSNIIRMWPVSIESLDKVDSDSSISENLRIRAKCASWVMRDGRVFLMMKHVLNALRKVSSLSLLFQNTDSMAIDAIEATRATTQSLIDGSLKNDLHQELMAYKSVINVYDGKHLKRVDEQFLMNYYEILENSQARKWRLVYLPESFKDFKKKVDVDFTNEEIEERSRLLSYKIFTTSEGSSSESGLEDIIDLDSSSLHFYQDSSPDVNFDVPLNFGLGSTFRDFLLHLGEKTIQKEAEDLYTNTYTSIIRKFGEQLIPGNLFIAVDRHIILDIIDFDGDFRTNGIITYPQMLLFPTEGIHCALDYVMSTIKQWPEDLRNDKTFKRIYKKLLEFQEKLNMPEEVEMVLKCILVIPSSNADSERTFSTANRLTAGERSSLSTKTINTMMHIQRNGPNLLTLEPSQLAYQWVHPLPGLGLRSGVHFTRGSSTNTMASIKKAFYAKNLGDANSLRNLIGPAIEVDILLNVFGDQAIRATLHSKSDIEDFRKDLIAVEKDKAAIFSIGIVNDENQ
ncbi:unnamed protein product [Cylicocyclus nassatus]|uniref:HAT C-terminal dimerisation domain-containing protein n=1 Tax=Cylicocyclus nassatus TaxID=53992 RepID=A0AA36GWU9_CYLNA|nr:unnamed protein product [Cylicocyclus nassatus]